MISLSAVIFLSSVLSGAALGKPSTRRQATPQICEPNFGASDAYDWNNSESIGLANGLTPNSGLVKKSPPAFFKFVKIGSNPPTFTVHAFDDPNLAVGLSANNSLVLSESTGNANGITKFIIECGDCGGAVQDNCFMRLSDRPDQCVQVGNNAPSRGSAGDPLFVTAPCRRDDSQRFNYFKRDLPPPSQPPNQGNTTTPPAQGQKICNPNFEFEGVRVANSAVNWGAPKFENNIDLVGESDFNKRLEIRFEQTGWPNPSYVAKSLNGSNLVVATRTANDNLYFIPADEDNQHKFFKIECVSGCTGASSVAPGGLTADGCTIKSTFNGKCVQVGNGPSAGNQGDRIFLNSCDGTDSQRFNFITSPFKQSGRTSSLASGVATVTGGAKVNLASDSNENFDAYLQKLVRNSYIAIGLLAGVFLGLVIFGAMMLSRGSSKGGDSKPRYTVVAGKDIEGFATHPSGRYSD